MRILEITSACGIGGAETNFVALVRGLTAQGESVRIFCPAGSQVIPRLRTCGLSPASWRMWGKLDLRTLGRFVSLIRANDIDIVHTHLTTASLLGSLAARIARRPCVATVHGYNVAHAFRFADRIIAVSQAAKDNLVSQGVSAAKVTVIYNGIELEGYAPQPVEEAKRASGFDPAVPRVGIVGRLAREKGQLDALRAWPSVLKAIPNARLTLVGEGRGSKEVGALVALLGMETQVDLLGFAPDPRLLTSACDVIAVPSRVEGLGLSAIEALALERPVIASDAGGLPEVISPGKTGLLFPRGDARALAEGIVRLFREPEAALRMAQAGRARVKEKFDAARQVAELREVFSQEVAAHGAATTASSAGKKSAERKI